MDKLPYDPSMLNARVMGCDKVTNGHLVESSGFPLNLLLDTMRYAIYVSALCTTDSGLSAEADAILEREGLGGVSQLNSREHRQSLSALTARIFTYWDRLGYAHDEDAQSMMEFVEQMSLQFPHIPGLQHDPVRELLQRNVKFWKSSRVFGEFYVVCQRRDGTILINAKFSKVYLVQGIAQSIGSICTKFEDASPATSSTLIGRKYTLTLLPWEGIITYDGICHGWGGHSEIMSAEERGMVVATYTRALEEGKVISKLKLRAEAAPSPPPDLSTLLGLGAATIEALALELKPKLDFIIAASPISAAESWVFRRHGYTEMSNPEHWCSVISCSSGPVGPMHIAPLAFQQLNPTVAEITALLWQRIKDAGRRRPAMIMIDSEPVIKSLKALYRHALVPIRVEYYPPPQGEELAAYAAMDPDSFGPLSGSDVQRCWYCKKARLASSTSVNPKALCTCSRCKVATYCGKACQVEHWPVHKRTCRAPEGL